MWVIFARGDARRWSTFFEIHFRGWNSSSKNIFAANAANADMAAMAANAGGQKLKNVINGRVMLQNVRTGALVAKDQVGACAGKIANVWRAPDYNSARRRQVKASQGESR
jgi:hypothetical protein